MSRLDPVRLATPEEIESIKDSSDLGPGCSVYTFGDAKAVLRQIVEMDPVHYGSLSNNQKHYFVSNLETFMRLSGVPFYYFNVAASDEFTQYRKVVENFGATPTSKEPEIRYKKNLL